MASPAPAAADYTQLAMTINSTVIVLATVMKVPQILAVLRSGTTHGISVLSLLMEFWAFTNLFAYPASKGYPLSGYMEFALLSLQDFILIFLVAKEKKKLNIVNTSIFVLYMSWIAALSMGYMPTHIRDLVIMTVTPLSASGKILQLLTIVRSRSAGSVSPTTWAIGTYTAGAKFFTNYLTIYDVLLMVTSGQACVLNCSICVAALIFKDSKRTEAEKKEN